jgi:hypothetical protein
MHTASVPRTYSREEADEILRRALEQQPDGGIHHDDLMAAAREVGIPEAAVEAAADEVGATALVRERVQLLRRQKRAAFARHLLSFLIVNGGIFLFDWFDGGPWFFHYLLIVWGIVLLLVGMRQLAPDEASLVRKAERELEREHRRAQRQRRRQAGSGRASPPGVSQLPGAAREFEAAVQEGVSALMSAAAKAIRDYSPGPKPRYRADDTAAQDDESSQQRSQQDTSPRHRRA